VDGYSPAVKAQVLHTVSVLVSGVRDSSALDYGTLVKLEIFPRVEDGNGELVTSLFEVALESFLGRRHTRVSAVSAVALECVASLAAEFTYSSILGAANGGNSTLDFALVFSGSLAWKALIAVRSSFFRKTMESRHAVGASDIFVDLIEASVATGYKRVSHDRHKKYAFRASCVRVLDIQKWLHCPGSFNGMELQSSSDSIGGSDSERMRSHLVLVLDPTEIYAVKPSQRTTGWQHPCLQF
jgi:hypothetical protein